MSKCFVFILFILFLISCRKQEKSERLPDYIIKVSKEQICEEKLPLYTLFDSVEVVFPDRRDSVLLGNIQGLCYNGKDYYVFDQFYQLFQFNPHGEVIHNFTKIGRGSHEYIYLDDVFYDSKREQLILLTSPYSKLTFIDKYGNYSREIELPFKGSNFECIASVKDSILMLGNYVQNEPRKRFGTFSYLYQDSVTPFRIFNERNIDGVFPGIFWAIGEAEDHELVVGYTFSYDTLYILSSQGIFLKQALKLQIDNPYSALSFRYNNRGLMMLSMSVNKGEHDYGYCLFHDRLSGESRMWNSLDFSLIGDYLCSDTENMYFVYQPSKRHYFSNDVFQKFGYKVVLEKLASLNLTAEDNPVILRYHLKTPEELRKVLLH